MCDQITRVEESLRMGQGDRPLPQKQISLYYDEVLLPSTEGQTVKAMTIWIRVNDKWYKVRATSDVQELIDMVLKVLDTEPLKESDQFS